MVSCLGLTSCFHREMSSLSSEGEGQNHPVRKRHVSVSEKEMQVTKTKETGALIKEETAETGSVSTMGWVRAGEDDQVPRAHEDDVATLQVKLSVFRDYAKSMGLCTTIAICLLYAGQSAAAIGGNVWLSAWSNDKVVQGRQNNTSLRLGVYAGLGILQGEYTGVPRRGSLVLSSPLPTP